MRGIAYVADGKSFDQIDIPGIGMIMVGMMLNPIDLERSV
jgi:hypothetical protein